MGEFEKFPTMLSTVPKWEKFVKRFFFLTRFLRLVIVLDIVANKITIEIESKPQGSKET